MSTTEQLRGIMAKVIRCNEQDIQPGTKLSDLKADSLHWVQIVVAVESTFDIEVDVEKMKDFASVGDFVTYIDNAKGKAAA